VIRSTRLAMLIVMTFLNGFFVGAFIGMMEEGVRFAWVAVGAYAGNTAYWFIKTCSAVPERTSLRQRTIDIFK
jgi:hypothetical protein